MREVKTWGPRKQQPIRQNIDHLWSRRPDLRTAAEKLVGIAENSQLKKENLKQQRCKVILNRFRNGAVQVGKMINQGAGKDVDGDQLKPLVVCEAAQQAAQGGDLRGGDYPTFR